MNRRKCCVILISFLGFSFLLGASIFDLFCIDHGHSSKEEFCDQNSLSSIGKNEMRCEGVCFCEDDHTNNNNKRRFSRSVGRLSSIFLSASAAVGMTLAKRDFDTRCQEEYIGYCSSSRIESEVENCEILESLEQEKSDEIQDFTPEVVEKIDICVGHCLISKNETNDLYLVSACLLGVDCKYNGGNNYHRGDSTKEDTIALYNLQQKGLVVPCCPECESGMTTPRDPSQIQQGYDGYNVIRNEAKVVNIEDCDVTSNFLVGADLALQRAKKYGIKVAILKEYSPSCGSMKISDGTFRKGMKKDGVGVTTALLRKNGIIVVNENEVLKAIELMRKMK